MMKIFKTYLTFIVFCFIALSCSKENDYGNVLVTIKYNGQAIDQPLIYMKKGTLTNPNISLDKYDKVGSGDASGQVTFSNLAPDNYFFYTRGYSSSKSTYVTGQTSITVKSRYRENSYKIIIDTK